MSRIIAAALVVAAIIAVGVQPAAGSKYHGGCNTRACLKRTCTSHACHIRVIIRPYRSWLRKVRNCESGGDYRIASGNGFFGAYQFTVDTWHRAGGRGMPHLAPPSEQDYRAVVWRRMIGNPHTTAGWPVCG